MHTNAVVVRPVEQLEVEPPHPAVQRGPAGVPPLPGRDIFTTPGHRAAVPTRPIPGVAERSASRVPWTPDPAPTPIACPMSFRDLARRVLVCTLVGGGLAATARSVRAQTTVDTRIGPVTNQWLSYGGAVGQAFLAPADPVMRSASLWVGAGDGTTAFRAVLQRWSGNPDDGSFHVGTVSGPALHTSDLRVVTGWGPTRFDFDLGGIALTPGQSYALFLRAESGTLNGYQSIPWANAYIGGNAVFGGGPTPDEEAAYDTGFIGTFSPVPEPAGLALVGTGAVAVGIGARRRRRC
jgi:hypothetical protein